MDKIKIGIIGCGFVGGALKTWIEENNAEECEVFVSDPPKGYNDDAVYDYCKRMGADWARVHQGMLLSGYINDTHTFVPGPDGKFGYGGKCFPKDVNAFTILTQGTPLGSLLTPLHTLNVHFRGVEEKI